MQEAERSRLNVLVAEDNLDVQRILRALIDSEPDMHCVSAVSDPARVLEEARERKARVVLLDLELGGVSGMEILKQGRSSHPDLVFIIFSGHSHPRLAQEARAHGAADYLVKPADLEVLADRIRSACRNPPTAL